MKFRTKPVGADTEAPIVIDAIQYCGEKNLSKVLNFILDGHMDFSHLPISPEHAKRGVAMEARSGDLRIPVEDGIDICRAGDWVIRSPEGKFGAIKQMVLESGYEHVPDVVPCPPPAEGNFAGADACAVGGVQ